MGQNVPKNVLNYLAIDYFVMILGYANVIHGVVASIAFSSIYYMYIL